MEQLHCAIKVRLAKEKIFFGPGVALLLKLTEEYESLNAAAKSMDLSYTKATRMIKDAEEALGFELLVRKIGGSGGGGSVLTPECTDFLNKYLLFENEIKGISSELLTKYLYEYI